MDVLDESQKIKEKALSKIELLVEDYTNELEFLNKKLESKTSFRAKLSASVSKYDINRYNSETLLIVGILGSISKTREILANLKVKNIEIELS